MRLLLTGDIHIGRSSTRASGSLSPAALRASSAWERVIDLAIDERVDILCLSGDVADEENKFWEAIGPLESGVARLVDAGVKTFAVSGNHDYDVFRRLADQLPPDHFHLLGRDGKWERHTIEREGRPALHIDGWSFPRESVARSPLLEYDLDPDASTPTLGLIHGDLDVPGSPFAPLESDRLRALPPHGWLLGHIHKPMLREGIPWILYPGSPQALDFGEPGRHGAWIVEVDHALGTPEPRPLSTVRYEAVQIDVSGAATEGAVETAILNRIRAVAEKVAAESGPILECLMLRLTIKGRTPLSQCMREITDNLRDELSLRVHGALVEVDKLSVATLPDVDVETYARAHSAPGAVARLLMALEKDHVSEDVAGLIARTKRALESSDDHKYFTALDRREITDEVAREHLRQEARALLTQLDAQTRQDQTT